MAAVQSSAWWLPWRRSSARREEESEESRASMEMSAACLRAAWALQNKVRDGRGAWQGGGHAAAMHGGRVTKHRTRGVRQRGQCRTRIGPAMGQVWTWAKRQSQSPYNALQNLFRVHDQ
jgi:hypothetical protein